MTTTVTIEPDLVSQIEVFADRRGLTFEQALHEVLRRGLVSSACSDDVPARFEVQPHASGFRPGIDPGKLNQLADQLEVEDFIAKARR